MRKWISGGAIMLVIVLLATAAVPQPPTPADRFKQEFLYRINSVRTRGCKCGTQWFPPVAPLVWNTTLQKAAYAHARDMNDRHYFSHTSKDGRSMQDRIVLNGYKFNGYQAFTVGENIAWGQQSIEQVMNEWFKSEGHCHNLMNGAFKEVGIVQYNDYWVQDFGGRVPWSAAEQKALSSGKAKVSQMKWEN